MRVPAEQGRQWSQQNIHEDEYIQRTVEPCGYHDFSTAQHDVNTLCDQDALAWKGSLLLLAPARRVGPPGDPHRPEEN